MIGLALLVALGSPVAAQAPYDPQTWESRRDHREFMRDRRLELDQDRRDQRSRDDRRAEDWRLEQSRRLNPPREGERRDYRHR